MLLWRLSGRFNTYDVTVVVWGDFWGGGYFVNNLKLDGIEIARLGGGGGVVGLMVWSLCYHPRLL